MNNSPTLFKFTEPLLEKEETVNVLSLSDLESNNSIDDATLPPSEKLNLSLYNQSTKCLLKYTFYCWRSLSTEKLIITALVLVGIGIFVGLAYVNHPYSKVGSPPRSMA